MVKMFDIFFIKMPTFKWGKVLTVFSLSWKRCVVNISFWIFSSNFCWSRWNEQKADSALQAIPISTTWGLDYSQKGWQILPFNLVSISNCLTHFHKFDLAEEGYFWKTTFQFLNINSTMFEHLSGILQTKHFRHFSTGKSFHLRHWPYKYPIFLDKNCFGHTFFVQTSFIQLRPINLFHGEQK